MEKKFWQRHLPRCKDKLGTSACIRLHGLFQNLFFCPYLKILCIHVEGGIYIFLYTSSNDLIYLQWNSYYILIRDAGCLEICQVLSAVSCQHSRSVKERTPTHSHSDKLRSCGAVKHSCCNLSLLGSTLFSCDKAQQERWLRDCRVILSIYLACRFLVWLWHIVLCLFTCLDRFKPIIVQHHSWSMF